MGKFTTSQHCNFLNTFISSQRRNTTDKLFVWLSLRNLTQGEWIISEMSHHLPSAITYTTIGISAIIVNLIEISLILRKRHLIKTFEYFLLNLATADCICSVILSIQNVLYPVTGEMENDVLGAFTAFLLTSSITNLLAISLHLLVVVKFPLQHHLWITKKRERGVVALIWTISLVSTCPFVNL